MTAVRLQKVQGPRPNPLNQICCYTIVLLRGLDLDLNIIPQTSLEDHMI